MWVPKWQRDRAKGVESPMPTQVVSNEEFIPRPQNDEQKKVERLIGEMSEENSKKLGMDRRAYLASSMGIAAAFLAQNTVYGNYWDVDQKEALEPADNGGEVAQGRVLHHRRAGALHQRITDRLSRLRDLSQHGVQAQRGR